MQAAALDKKDSALYSKMFKPSKQVAPIAVNGDTVAEEGAEPMAVEEEER